MKLKGEKKTVTIYACPFCKSQHLKEADATYCMKFTCVNWLVRQLEQYRDKFLANESTRLKLIGLYENYGETRE
jgi:hypothetical protein